MADITLKSYQQIVGQMAAKLMADTPLTDLHPGSAFMTLIEAAASNDFSLEGRLIQLLQLRSIDKTKGTDLENLAAEMGVSPSRIGAQSSRVFIRVIETAFTKISTHVFSGAAAPASGDTTLKVLDASAFTASGTAYVGRGTATSEAISYLSITNNGSYYTLNLSSTLTKDHLVGEEVTLAQGGDRMINAGNIVRVPAGGSSPAVNFRILTSTKMFDGEDSVSGIDATATDPGTTGNVGIGRISEFASPPWGTASVTNPLPATGGTDVETDAELRQRIKDNVHNLGRGTQKAIMRAVIGVNDDDEGKRVVSAFLREPTTVGETAILYIDDGTGFAPSFAGVGEETILASAIGTESYFQLQQYPLVKAQTVSIGQEPFNLQGGEKLLFYVDGVAEERSLPTFNVAGVVTAQEVIEGINSLFTSVEARAKDGRVFVTPTTEDPNYIAAGTASSNDANVALRFTIRNQYTLRLYKNEILLDKNGSEAQIQSLPNSQWSPFGASETLQLRIDGILSPLVTITDADFASLTGSTTIQGASVADWATVLNAMFIGVTFTARTDGTFVITSNRGKSSAASVVVIAGTLIGKNISAGSTGTGSSADYKLNRLLGQIELTNRLSANDELKAGTVNTAGFVQTIAQSSFDLSATSGLPASLVVVSNMPASIVAWPQTINPLVFSSPVAGIQRVTGSVGQFSDMLSNDWCYCYSMPRNGLLRVYAVATNGSYIDLYDPSPGSGTQQPDGVTSNVIFFRTDGFPQEIILPVNPALSGSGLVTSLNSQLSGAEATLMDSGAVRIAALRLDSTGALAIPAICGNAINLGFLPGSYQNNDPHTAAIESSDLLGIPSGDMAVSFPDNLPPFNDYQETGITFLAPHSNRPVVHYQGASSMQYREPQQRVTGTRMTLRDEVPAPSVGLGLDLRSTSASGLEFGESDNLVFVVDDDPARKTFDIPMYVDGTVAAPSVPSTTQFDAQDSNLSMFGSSARWLGYKFEDYRIWMRANKTLPTSTPNTALRLVAVPFGPQGQLYNAGVFYPTGANSPISATYNIDESNGKIMIAINLASDAPHALGTASGSKVYVTASGAGPYAYNVRFLPPIDLSAVNVGDILSLTDSSFNAANLGTIKIAVIDNLVDNTLSYEHKKETKSDVNVAIGTDLTMPAPTTYTLRVGDKITQKSISKAVSSTTPTTIVVPTGGAYAAGGGTVYVNAIPFTYTSYAAGTFSGVTPDPTPTVNPGDTATQYITPVTQLVLTVISQSHATMAAALTNGSGWDIEIEHQAYTASAVPNFTVATGDKIAIGGNVFTVGTVYTAQEWSIDLPFTLSGSNAGSVSRLVLTGTRITSGVTQSVVLTTPTGVQVYPLAAANLASAVITAINATAGVKDMILASNGTGSSGAGIIVKSTADEFGSGTGYLPLVNGESFIKTTSATNPVFTLKEPLDVAPTIGDAFRLIPMTPRNIYYHLNKRQISGLSVSSQIDLIDGARKVQVASLTPGGLGQVYAVGGRASGSNTISVRETSRVVSPTIGVLLTDRTAVEMVAPGQTLKFYQTGRTKKSWTLTPPISTTTIQIQLSGGGIARAILSVPFTQILSYTHTGTVEWSVRKMCRDRVRFRINSGTASLPATLKDGDWVLVGDGSTYAGSTAPILFSAANRGMHRIVETDALTYFDLEIDGVEEFVSATAAPMLFMPYHSVMLGDQISITNESPLSTVNQGTFVVTNIPSTTSVEYTNTAATAEGPMVLGTAGVDSVRILDQGFSTYRKVVSIAPSPLDPTNMATLLVTPGTDMGLFTEAQAAKISFPAKVNFPSDPVPGLSGYQYWTGLKRRVQRTIDGWEPDTITFPGVRAAGVSIEAREPQIQRVTMSIKVKTKDGIALASIADSIKSEVVGFINAMGLSDDVILSDIVALIQGISGVDSVVLENPKLDQERIVVGDKSVARTSPSEISIS